MDNHEKMDKAQYDQLLHLESVLDIEVGGKDLVVRLDLDVPLSHYTPPPQHDAHGSHTMHSTEDMQRSQQKDQSKSTMGRKTQ